MYLQQKMTQHCPLNLPAHSNRTNDVTVQERTYANDNTDRLNIGPGGIVLPAGLQMPRFNPEIFQDRLKRTRVKRRFE